MITRFKLFEDIDMLTRLEFWLLKLKNPAYNPAYILASLKTIGCNEKEIEYFQDLANSVDYDLYINRESLDELYGWMKGNKRGYDWYINHEFKYMGIIKPTKKFIEDAELEIDTKKYNL